MNQNNKLESTSTPKLPSMRVGDDDFKSLLINSDVFVDKSLFIKEIIQSSGYVTLITRPRRWGKSLNMNMLKRFLEIEVDAQGNPLPVAQRLNNILFLGGEIDLGLASGRKKILKPLKIATYRDLIEERQGKYPVILLNLKDVKGSSYQEIEDKVKLNVRNLYEYYDYLIDSNKISEKDKQDFQNYLYGSVDLAYLQNSLVFLNRLLFEHFGQKSYILIDEYDTPINSAYLKVADNKPKEFEQVLDLFRGIFGSSLKTNQYLEKGVITGILRIAKANLFSDLNNLTENTLLDEDFSSFYGFTQQEVDELLTKVPTKTEPQSIKNWYNGYTFGFEIIYNPWSIMQCLAHQGKLDHYWLDSGGTGLVDKVLLSDSMQEDLQSLLEGRGIVKKLYKQISLGDIERNRDIFYSLLVFAGYLNPILANDDEEDPRYRLTIPNKEVRNIYVERVTNWVTSKLNISSSDYDDFIGLLIRQEIDQFGKRLGKYLMNSTSYHDLLSERDYHNLVGGIIAPLTRKYIIESNKESGLGRFDHILIPRESKNGDSAIIIEYKLTNDRAELSSKAKEALEQINNKQYDNKINQYPHVTKIIRIAMAFCGKEMELVYRAGANRVYSYN